MGNGVSTPAADEKVKAHPIPEELDYDAGYKVVEELHELKTDEEKQAAKDVLASKWAKDGEQYAKLSKDDFVKAYAEHYAAPAAEEKPAEEAAPAEEAQATEAAAPAEAAPAEEAQTTEEKPAEEAAAPAAEEAQTTEAAAEAAPAEEAQATEAAPAEEAQATEAAPAQEAQEASA